MKVGSKELIRDINNNIVLENIIEHEPLSRADLSKMLGLTKATISSIVKDLLSSNLIIEIGSGPSDGGRKPVLLKFNNNAGCSICVDLGVDEISVMLTDLGGKNLLFKEVEVCDINSENILDILIPIIDEMIKKSPNTTYGIVGITIGIHGVVYENNIAFTPYYDLQDFDLADRLKRHYNIPIYLLNEANLSVLGEKTFAINGENMANISIHSGIGLGLVINNKLYEGYTGFAGEFGHTIIEIDGRACPCGNKGCLEQYASERALLRSLAAKKNRARISFDEFQRLYKNNDRDAIGIMDNFIKYLSIGINNILTAFNPEIIIINSRFTRAFPHILKDIKEALNPQSIKCRDIVLSTLEDKSILYGAAYINIINFLGVKYYNPSSNKK